MSQHDHTLQEALEQHLAALKSGQEPDAWMRDLLEWLLQELLDLEFDQHLGADHYERTEDRRGYRNEYYARDLFTRVGRLSLRLPRDRQGKFSTELFERYQRSEKALVLALQESYLQDVSTRKVKKITEQLCGVRFSKDQVSSMAKELDEQLETWRNRPLEKKYLYLVVDAHYEHVREDGQIESDASLLVKGICDDGYREILSVMVAPAEEEVTWGWVFSELIDRGLDPRAVCSVTSDDHKGIRKALRRYLPKATWHRCQTHHHHNAGGYVPAKARKEVHDGLRDVFNAPDRSQALARAERLMEGWRNRFPKLMAWLENTLEQALAVFSLPENHRKRMRTTNSLERFNDRLARRARVVRIFPNRASYLRLASALAMEQSEEWITGHRYLDMSVYEDEELEQEPEPAEVQENELVKV